MSFTDLTHHIAVKNTWGALGDVATLVGGVPTAISTNYTLSPSDNGAVLRVEGTSAITVTVPATLPEGFNVGLIQYGTGVATVSGGAGATKRGSGVSTAQYAFTNVLVIKNIGAVAAEFVVLGGA